MCQTRSNKLVSNKQTMEAAGPCNSRHQGCGSPGRGRSRGVEPVCTVSSKEGNRDSFVRVNFNNSGLSDYRRSLITTGVQ